VTPPYQQPGANVAFWTLFGLFALGEYALRFHSHFNRSGRRAERCSLLVVLAAVVGGMLGGFSWRVGRRLRSTPGAGRSSCWALC
jgi:hypothetical protein